ncbi:8-amino-7-oxononanoate synthase [Photobacterium gaetbulicola]|uniref:8-amino-7-oxononanoate synthase n=1 Tax=Photobacterium gaetbulicola TaxID=1295392 RepID=A0A0B9G1W1_9GAMM|nr:8-amino-7-oxononanoate synthase [Photobacterium gaetbulicola]KHT62703.1 8-amino-7-oxononanoate synthase [Photobacterium gaetbulicola]
MHRFKQRIASALEQRHNQGLYRTLSCLGRGQNMSVQLREQSLLNFSSNDYLGLAQEPALVAAWQEGLSLYGAGSGASPLVTGFHSPHQYLQSQLAEWLGYDQALLFSSGFGANQALLFTMLQKGDYLLQDKLNHASLVEAGMLSPATMRRFAHNDPASLSRLLARIPDSCPKLVVTEGVFSMDGDLSPLSDIAGVCQQSGSMLVVDDAHGCGVLGESGRGSCAHAGIKPDILVVTFGKAFGLQGAAILCSQDVAEYLMQFARHFIYSTAMPPAQAHALSKACDMIQQQGWRRDKLVALGECLVGHLSPDVEMVATPTPIKPLMVGSSERAVSFADKLRQRGLWVSAIRPPTVPANAARLRVTLTAAHKEPEVRMLAQAINEVWHEE